ncbi:PAS domain-containing sensor histidine kinase [Pararhodobacter marinus]|uniref:histidine kinase n=1 Tax=Pararhodobacter marinus TaxID=2184063 RepID=A0A2U2CGJ1_9RHOB|nr:PAS domain-containing sensor histidine kinase [Pararhodobacter marinus]PWE31013.1 PAS domain-containing sensor histidine kinase [Pararhodobacter marinus]
MTSPDSPADPAQQAEAFGPPRRSPLQRRVQTLGTLALVLLAPVLVAATVLVLGPFSFVSGLPSLRVVLFADLVYILVVAVLVLTRIVRLIRARRSQAVGAKLHLRLSSLFAVIALLPAITVAVFAVVTINLGLESWFSDRVRNVVGNSLAAAEAYQGEQERNLIEDAQAVADVLAEARRRSPTISEGEVRQLLSQAQAAIQRGLRVAFIINSDGELLLRGDRSYLFDFIEPAGQDIARALDGELVLIKDWPNSEFRALVALPGYVDRLLYVARAVDGEILSLLDETQQTIQLYTQLEAERGTVLFNFALVYIGFALILILAAVWLGMWFAEGLSRPIGRLAAAAQNVGKGDLDVQVPEERGDDEIATMGRVFNQMTWQLKGQREALLFNTRQIEERRRLFDSVLGSVTAGVIGLDAEGRVDFVNRAAETLIGVEAEGAVHSPLTEIVPEFEVLLTRLRSGEGRMHGGRVQDEIRLSRNGRLESLLVRFAERRTASGELEGYVVAFDDVTELVSAQRMAAWGDVARRIAHEIKNPLTPIQLSAERIKRKFSKVMGDEDAASLGNLTDVIVRQTNDLRRIVDEFSRFARMPEPDRRPHDLVQILRDVATLQEAGQEAVAFDIALPDAPLVIEIDATMISQAMTNLIKNAGEATEGLIEAGNAPVGYQPRIALRMDVAEDRATITIADNGIGLPEDRARLFEPYVTTRERGTGLGLPIVKKIIEEHGGSLVLRDAPVMPGCAHSGALAEIRLPILRTPRGSRNERTGAEA